MKSYLPSRTKPADLELILDERLRAYPFVSKNILRTAADVIIFGSYPAGLERRNSDLDVLIVGEARLRIKTKQLDLLVLPGALARSPAWLHSEIFRHIAAFGVSLRTGTPTLPIRIDGYAADRKLERLLSFTRKLEPIWPGLDDSFKRKYLTKLRRETQRYQILRSGGAVPPTAVLDSAAQSIEDLEEIYRDFQELVSCGSPKYLDAARMILRTFETHLKVPGAPK